MRRVQPALSVGIVALLLVATVPHPATAGDADLIVKLINAQYGTVCKAEVSGWFSKTLKIDWTGSTTKLHAIKILAEIGSIKERLYADGVRYFQFPNDAGTYNVLDWTTGEKRSTTDSAPFYFSR